MAVPFRRVSKTRKAKRRTHQNVKSVTLTDCTNCGARVKPHHVCGKCGYYKGKEVISVD